MAEAIARVIVNTFGALEDSELALTDEQKTQMISMALSSYHGMADEAEEIIDAQTSLASLAAQLLKNVDPEWPTDEELAEFRRRCG
jgi:hypothetical protein